MSYDGTLGIAMTDSSDSGEYVCTASNIAGEDSKIFTLQVLGMCCDKKSVDSTKGKGR